VERDKGMELSSAQIEMRLLATRALNGRWDDNVPSASEVGVSSGSGAVKDRQGVGSGGVAGAGAEGKEDECILIEPDADVPSGSSRQGGVAQGTGGRVLKRMEIGGEDSEDDDVPLAVKQQKLHAAKLAAGEEDDKNASSSSCVESRSSSSSSSSSAVSCPSPTAIAEAAARQERKGDSGEGSSAAAGVSRGDGSTSDSAQRPAKKRKENESGQQVVEQNGQQDALGASTSKSAGAGRDAGEGGSAGGVSTTTTTSEKATSDDIVVVEDMEQTGQTRGCVEAKNIEERSAEGENGGGLDEETTPDLELTRAVLGVTAEMVIGWAAADLEMLRSYLAAHNSDEAAGGAALEEVARQGVLEAFTVAVCVCLSLSISLLLAASDIGVHDLLLSLFSKRFLFVLLFSPRTHTLPP